MKRRRRSPSRQPKPGEREYEFGIPFAGIILKEEEWVRTAIKRLPESGPLDWVNLFGNNNPVALDIGCGNGRFTIESAFSRPDWNHLAIDILPAVVRYGTRRANQRGLANTRFAVSDGWKILANYIAKGSLNEIHIYHPQPYADPKHASRRMLTPEFLALMHHALADNGKLFLQTDRQAYWSYIVDTVGAIFDLTQMEDWESGPRIRSRREIIARKQGLPIYRGIAVRRDSWTEETLQRAIEQLPAPNFVVDRGEEEEFDGDDSL